MGTNHEDTHINESILSEEILEDQKKNRIDHMTYLPGMEDIGSEILDQVVAAMEAYDYNTSIKRLLSDRSSDRDDDMEENDAPEVFRGNDADELEASGFSEVSEDDMGLDDVDDSDFIDDNDEE